MRGFSRDEYGKQAVDDVLAWAVRRYRRHPELVYPFLLFGVVSLVFEFRFELLWELFDVDPSVGVTADPTPIRDLFSEDVVDAILPVLEDLFVVLLLGTVFLFVLTFVFFLFAAGIAFLVAADERDGTTRTQTTRAIVTIRRLPALIVASIAGSILVALGTLLFVVPGLYLATRLTLGGPAIVVDGHGPVSGLRAAWHRSAGQLFEVFVVGIGGAIVISLVGFVPLLGEAISVLVLLPVATLALAYLYIEPTTSGNDEPT